MELLNCLAVLVLSHIVGDGLLQSRKMAMNKSKKLEVLATHILFLSLPIFLTMWYFAGFSKAIFFTSLNGIFHGLIDWNLWNGYGAIVKKRITRDAYEQVEKGYNTPASIPYVIENSLTKYVREKEYVDDAWYYHFIVIDQALHVLTFITLLRIGVFI